MKKILSIILSITIITTTMLGFTISAKADVESVDVSVPVEYHQAEARTILGMVNAFRTSNEAWVWNETTTAKIKYNGLRTLQYDYDLEKIAMQRAAEIAVYYAHERPNTKMFYTAYNTYASCGENIAAGFTSAADVMEGWKETYCDYAGQGHRRNMLKSTYTTIGLACVYYNGTYYWVQEFRNPDVNGNPTQDVNGVQSTNVEIANSAVTGQSIAQNTNYINIPCGSFTDLPQLNGSLTTTNAWPNSTNPNVTLNSAWTVGDPSIAEVIGSKIYAYKLGTTTITTKAFGITYTATINVSVGVNGETQVAPPHFHSYSKKVTKAPTNKAVGKMTYTCACGHSYTENIAKLVNSSFKKVTPTKNTIKATWKMVVSANGYEVQYSSDKKFKKNKSTYKANANTSTGLTIRKLKSKKTYYLRIRSYRIIEGKKYYTPWSSAKTVKTK